MNRHHEYGYEKNVHRDDSLGEQATETAKEYAGKAVEIGEDAIDRADEYLRPIGLSLREKPLTTLAVFGSVAFAAGAFWMLRNARAQESRMDEILAQIPDLYRRARSWW